LIGLPGLITQGQPPSWVFDILLFRGPQREEILKKSFILYTDQKQLFKKLPDDIAGKLIKHIFDYVDGEYSELDDLLLEIAFEPIKQSINRDPEKWEKQLKQRSDAGKASANKRKSTKPTSVEPAERKQTSVESRDVSLTDSDSDSDSGSGNVSDKYNKKELDFSEWPNMPSKEVYDEWIAQRKKKKLSISQLVINKTGRQLSIAVLAGHPVDECLSEVIERNWTGFKAEWMKNERNQTGNQQSAAGRVAAKLDEIAARDIRENGFAESLGDRNIQGFSGSIPGKVDP